MKRQLFIEVFKQISSKIDQLKTFFNHHDAYYKVNTLTMCLTKKIEFLYSFFFQININLSILGGQCSFNRSF